MTQQWKPIASAPKDGTAIWAIGQLYTKPFQYECEWNGAQWYHGFGDGWESLEPSHWMPLPPAPGTPPASAQDDAKDERQAFEAAMGEPLRVLLGPGAGGMNYFDGTEYDSAYVQAAWLTWKQARASAPLAGDSLEVLTDEEILDRWDTHVGDSPITESDKLCFSREIEHDLLSKLSQREAKDAARYRWWCDTGNDITAADTIGGKPTIDAAIDAEMAASQQQEG
ncbi:hypothetical protein LMG26685_02156 [Achromobacter mucicolens]|uniref:hypothetical protein n=1 Tax=Achromobacter mucicolens TaxID=1389922 RepID=UPI0009D42969|nr:hypothetical protein [Achromobacter mucicolens]OXC91354.1 hypothetical protein BMR85_009585 [Achromobacter sp. KAs 3-5]CAB3643378.1 hypothetical protein LMG26685_02156 [Achromobacter mucicolens]